MPTKMLMNASIMMGTTQSKFGWPAIRTAPIIETGRVAASSEAMSTSADPSSRSEPRLTNVDGDRKRGMTFSEFQPASPKFWTPTSGLRRVRSNSGATPRKPMTSSVDVGTSASVVVTWRDSPLADDMQRHFFPRALPEVVLQVAEVLRRQAVDRSDRVPRDQPGDNGRGFTRFQARDLADRPAVRDRTHRSPTTAR